MKLESMKQGKETETEQNFRIFFLFPFCFIVGVGRKRKKNYYWNKLRNGETDVKEVKKLFKY
jgi:hypothetical protein